MSDPAKPEGSVEIFCSYAHTDEALRQEFEKHVAGMKRQNLIQVWNDSRIEPGDWWAKTIFEHLDRADIIVLLVSADFMASDFCFNELKRAMERQARGEAVVVPVIVRQCEWKVPPLKDLQVIPANGLPVTSWPNRDEAWTDVATRMKVAVEGVLRRITAGIEAQVNLPPPFVERPAESLAASMFRNQNADYSGDIEATQQMFPPDAEQNRRRWEILQDTQKKILEIQREVGANQKSKHDAVYHKWDKFIQEA